MPLYQAHLTGGLFIFPVNGYYALRVFLYTLLNGDE
nr:MAG TPA: hypothetical protein [Caudoviricetes sp.]